MCVAACRYLVPLEGPDGPYLCGGATEVISIVLDNIDLLKFIFLLTKLRATKSL
jgi:hypothetical protein